MGDPTERFWAKVEIGLCWEWTGALGRGGYGYFRVGPGVVRRVHRLAWEWLVGPIPDGLQMDHVCRNRRCVNPDHLEPVTDAENRRRGFPHRWADWHRKQAARRVAKLAGPV